MALRILTQLRRALESSLGSRHRSKVIVVITLWIASLMASAGLAHQKSRAARWQPLEFFQGRLDEEINQHERRVDGTNAKAGILLVFVGVLVGAVKDKAAPNGLQQSAQWVAALGGVAILVSLFVPAASGLGAGALRNLYDQRTEDEVRDVAFDTADGLLELNKSSLRWKIRILRFALAMLIMALSLLVWGTFEKSRGVHHDRAPNPQVTAPASASPPTGPRPRGQPHR